ncbi:putative glycoside hydrolase [Novipirellula aureliae]|uniref:putative glycoside hydrolase n=1 Tax=Novipirellula aureliae TaxID=2527966 RepID=UPI001E4EFC70|nr:putative glycoside hydrolase [Novipirellula aureliae]
MFALFLLWGLAVLIPRESFTAEFYVSVDGAKRADGSIAKPFGSLPAAVDAVRALRKSGDQEPAVIYLREGRHQLNQTLVLGMEDGAPVSTDAAPLELYGAGDLTGPAHLTFAAYPGEKPVLSAGVPVTGWTRLESASPELPAEAAGNVWVADMPVGMDRFYTLYDRQGRLRRARNAGFAYTKSGDQRTLHFPEGALKSWDNIGDVEVQVRPSHPWVINMLPLASVDIASGVAKTGVSATYRMGPLPGWVHNPSGSTVWVENILEALNEPGEWVVNTQTRKIYLWPSDPAPDGSPRGILAPCTSELIRVEGDIDYDGPKDKPVCGIAFSRLTFSHADRWTWTTDETRLGWGLQHDWDMFDRPTAMLRFRGAEDCRVTACRFIDSGGTGVRLDLYAQRNRIENCEFAHLGEAGILLVGYGPGTKDVNHHNDIVNNLIHHFSEITWHSPGIWAWQSGHNRMVHNELHHSGYAAVLITTRVNPRRGGGNLNGEGARTVRSHEIADEVNTARNGYENWKNREKYLHARHNLLESNEISHAVQLLSDGNAIYISGTGTGNIIRYNFVHDNAAHSLPAAIRCDDDQHETLIYGNVLYKNFGFAAAIASKGVNDIINNFVVAPVAAPIYGYLSFEWVPVTGSKVQRNIVMSHPDGGSAYVERLKNGIRNTNPAGGPKIVDTDMESNLYYHPTDSHWMDEHFSKMRAVGKEKDSLFGDPLFTDPASGDFSFRPGSPALALGIEALDVSKMGRLEKNPYRISDGSVFVPQDYYPEFRWDTVPMYYMFGDTTRTLTPEEVEFIAARTDYLCIEKSHGYKELGAAELGAKHEAAAFKKIKPEMKVLFYFNSAYAWPFTSYNQAFRPGQIDKYPELKKFLLVDPETGKLAHRNNTFFFDVLNPEFREWWSGTVAKGVADSGCDGVFIDQMHGFFWLRQDRSAEVEKAMGQMMAALKEKMGPDKILLANNAHQTIADHVFPVMDASMFEHYRQELLSKEGLLRDWDDMLRIAQAGKMSIFRIGVEQDRPQNRQGDPRSGRSQGTVALAKERVEYYLACYLIGAQPYSYFQYGWGWTLSSGSLHDYPELSKPLGAPKGAYERTTPEGWEFTREFEHASVWVNTESGEGKIVWK